MNERLRLGFAWLCYQVYVLTPRVLMPMWLERIILPWAGYWGYR